MRYSISCFRAWGMGHRAWGIGGEEIGERRAQEDKKKYPND
jgi:hypothetical protein